MTIYENISQKHSQHQGPIIKQLVRAAGLFRLDSSGHDSQHPGQPVEWKAGLGGSRVT